MAEDALEMLPPSRMQWRCEREKGDDMTTAIIDGTSLRFSRDGSEQIRIH